MPKKSKANSKRKRVDGAQKSRVKKSKLTTDEQIKQCFDLYQEDALIEEDNLLKFVSDLGIEPDDIVLLVLCEHMECETGGEITWVEFERGMKKLHCKSTKDLQSRLDGLRSTLALPEQFDATYRFAFKLNLEPNKKILAKDVAVALWELLLPNKFDLLKQWVEFVESRDDIKWISKDVFCKCKTKCLVLVSQSKYHNQSIKKRTRIEVWGLSKSYFLFCSFFFVLSVLFLCFLFFL